MRIATWVLETESKSSVKAENALSFLSSPCSCFLNLKFMIYHVRCNEKNGLTFTFLREDFSSFKPSDNKCALWFLNFFYIFHLLPGFKILFSEE